MSSTITMRPCNGDDDHLGQGSRASRWAALMGAWRQKNRESACSQGPALSPSLLQVERSIDVTEHMVQTSQRVLLIEQQMGEVSRRLDNIARLLQPVTKNM
ncbi:hypothetical protein LPJ75_004225 [Coemansia sp. RSA 2598]|nr:hypothetical protein LPJ75_004225 [Coemansia sp. RSA 2598]